MDNAHEDLPRRVEYFGQPDGNIPRPGLPFLRHLTEDLIDELNIFQTSCSAEFREIEDGSRRQRVCEGCAARLIFAYRNLQAAVQLHQMWKGAYLAQGAHSEE